MDLSTSFQALVGRLQSGDDEAAAQVFQQYAQRLIALADQRLNRRLQGKVDPEDVVQSVFRSFFQRHAAGQFQLDSADSLWSLLAQITVRKCIRQAERFAAQQRDIRREHSPQPPDESSGAFEFLSREPRAEDVVLFEEAVEEFLEPLQGARREVVQLSMEGCSTEEISQRLGCHRRTVQRELLAARRHLLAARDSA